MLEETVRLSPKVKILPNRLSFLSNSMVPFVCVVVDDDEIVMLPTEDAVHLGLPGLDRSLFFVKLAGSFQPSPHEGAFPLSPKPRGITLRSIVPDMRALSLNDIFLQPGLEKPTP